MHLDSLVFYAAFPKAIYFLGVDDFINHRSLYNFPLSLAARMLAILPPRKEAASLNVLNV
jgi:hypothetical protein